MIKDYDFSFKIVVVGNSTVGKSSLLLRFIKDQFNGALNATLGEMSYIKKLTVDKKVVKLKFHDTAGQERFRSITSSYYKGADAIIMVYDVTDQRSFDDLNDYWINNIEEHADCNVEILLIGNKVDLDNRIVPQEQGRLYALYKTMDFAEVSAKTNVQVSESLITLARNLKNKRESGLQLAGLIGLQRLKEKEKKQNWCC